MAAKSGLSARLYCRFDIPCAACCHSPLLSHGPQPVPWHESIRYAGSRQYGDDSPALPSIFLSDTLPAQLPALKYDRQLLLYCQGSRTAQRIAAVGVTVQESLSFIIIRIKSIIHRIGSHCDSHGQITAGQSFG